MVVFTSLRNPIIKGIGVMYIENKMTSKFGLIIFKFKGCLIY